MPPSWTSMTSCWPMGTTDPSRVSGVIGDGLPRTSSEVRAEQLMRRALEVAEQNPAEDIPVGAVVFGPDGRELGAGTNRREVDADPTGHAEIAAIRAAVQTLGDAWRLEDCTLVVTDRRLLVVHGLVEGAARVAHAIPLDDVSQFAHDPFWNQRGRMVLGFVDGSLLRLQIGRAHV